MSVRVVDGGLSTALEEAGHRLDGELWAARLLIDDPDAIVAAHLAYLRAGVVRRPALWARGAGAVAHDGR